MSTEKGVKLDTGKLRYDLVPLDTVRAIASVLTFGASKYTDNGWQSVENGYDRYKAAMVRHQVAVEIDGEWLDKESRLPHMWHFLTNAMFMVHFKQKEKEDEQMDNSSTNEEL